MTTLGPYELNTIVTGDCAEMMSALPDGCIDLTVTSPPYDSLREYRGYTFDFEPIARQLWRVTKEGGVVVWVVADETRNFCESLTSAKQKIYFVEACGFGLLDTMIYKKLSYAPAYPNLSRYASVFEYMFIFSKGKPKTFNILEESKSNNLETLKRKMYSLNTSMRQKDGSKVIKSIQDNKSDKKARTNIWEYIPSGNHANDKYALDHPAIFPEALARDHIISWSNPGDVVLDPLMGSGTTAKQAHLLGRHYLGFDISAEYCELARRRVANVEAQPFLMPPIAETNGHTPEQAALFAEAA